MTYLVFLLGVRLTYPVLGTPVDRKLFKGNDRSGRILITYIGTQNNIILDLFIQKGIASFNVVVIYRHRLIKIINLFTKLTIFFA